MLINSIASYIAIHVHTTMLLAKQKYLGCKIVQGQSEFATILPHYSCIWQKF